jgi:hypothetical protein
MSRQVFDTPIPRDHGFRIRRVLARSLSTWSCNVLPFTAVAAIVYAPILVYAFWVLEQPFNLARLESVDRWLLLGPLMLEPIVAGLIAHAVLRQHRGKPTGVLEAIGEAARQFLPLLAVTLVGAILVSVGVFALVIPGLIIYFAFFVAGPVAAIEKTGIGEAFGRSAELTNGHRLKLFGVVLVIGLMTYASSQWLASAARSVTTLEDLKLYIAIYYLFILNISTLRAVVRASSYVELAGDDVPTS